MTKLLRNFNISFSALFFIVLISHSAPGAICPLGDLDGNCKVDLVDRPLAGSDLCSAGLSGRYHR